MAEESQSQHKGRHLKFEGLFGQLSSDKDYLKAFQAR